MWAVTKVLIEIVEWLFVVGIIGSAVVILMSGVEDVHSIFEPDEPAIPAAVEVKAEPRAQKDSTVSRQK